MHMTDEYAAQHFHKMGWMWGRLEVMKEEKTWGDLKAKRIEAEVRQKLAKEIEEKREPFLELAKDDEFHKGVCNGMFYAMLILGHPKDEVIKKFPRAHWWCKDCRIGSSMWYEVNVPIWNCPRCKKEWPPYAKENSNDIN
jgi:ribosomal protein L37AE/L43A